MCIDIFGIKPAMDILNQTRINIKSMLGIYNFYIAPINFKTNGICLVFLDFNQISNVYTLIKIPSTEEMLSEFRGERCYGENVNS